MNRKGKRGCALLLASVLSLSSLEWMGSMQASQVDAAAPSGQTQFYDIGSGKKVLVSDTSKTDGYQILSEAGTYTVDGKSIGLYKRGDAGKDADGQLTSQDLVAAKNAATSTITTVSQKAADVNGDGKVDGQDCAFLRNSIVKDYDIMTTTKSQSLLGQSVMPLVGYYGPTDASSYSTVKDLGVNAVVINAEDLGAEKAKEILKAAEENGIAVYLNDTSVTDPDSTSVVSDVKALAQANATYDGYASFAGYYMSDGAYIHKQGTSDSGKIFASNGIAQYKNTLASIAPYQNLSSYFNLLPYNSKALAYSLTGKEDGASLDFATYKEYVQSAVKAGADYLSNDFLLRSDNSNTLNTAAFYQNLDYLSALSKEEDIQTAFHGMIQVGSYYDTVNTKDSKSNLPTAEEMYLQASAALAFGAKGLRYNVLAQPKAYAENVDNDFDPYDYNRSGLISYNGELNTKYANAAKNMNTYVQAVDDVLMHAEHKGILTTDDTVSQAATKSKMENYGALTTVSGANALVGCFTYLTGDVYVLANTSLTAKTTVTMDFSQKVEGVLTTFDGSALNKSGKTLEVSLNPGESAMLVLGERVETQEEVVSQKTGMDAAVEDAATLKNTVQAYYTDVNRTGYTIENPQMKLTHGTKTFTSLTTADGKEYLGSDSIKVFVTDGKTNYWANNSSTNMRVNTTKLGYYYYETKLQNLNFGSSVPGLYLEKTYHTYADKVNEVVRLITTKDYASSLTKVGYCITVPKTKVDRIIIDGTENAQIAQNGNQVKDYIGFDIKGVGVVGFTVTGQDTSCAVTADATGYYFYQQKDIAFATHDEDLAGATGELSMANRIYTDTTHTFDGLKQVAYEEANPIADKIEVKSGETNREVTYDYVSGNYQFAIDGLDMGTASTNQAAKPTVQVNIREVPDQRRIWLHAHTDKDLEAAVVVDGAKQIPIEMQTSKNFATDNTIKVYEPDASTWGDSYMPLLVGEKESYQFFLVHLYQNWGNYPLKQLSSIEYFTSYYHLSYGVTETTCIAPYYATTAENGYDFAWFLPDFRGASSDAKKDSTIQKNSGAAIYAPGAVTANDKAPATKAASAQYRSSKISSSGMTYADVTTEYQSPDGAYSYTMRQVEQPQGDETRVQYQITFKFHKDTTLSAENFQILGVNSRIEKYQKMSYMDTNKSMKEVSLYKTNNEYNNALYPLASKSAYFACYDVANSGSDKEVSNVGVIIRDDGGKPLAVQTKKSKNVSNKNTTYCALTFQEEQKFQAEDTYTVDLLLLPYGAKSCTNYDNVTNVYKDAVTNKVTMDASVGTKREDAILTVEAVDNQAEFTLKGGTKDASSSVDYTVKVTGFEHNVLPTVLKKDGSGWVTYQYDGLSDRTGNVPWEGYTVQYDKATDTYSYSFVVTKNAEDVTFRVVEGTNATVNYYVNGENAYSRTYKASEVTVEPTSTELGVEGQKIAGYYTDIAYLEGFTHGGSLREDCNVYVDVVEELFITPTQIYQNGGLSTNQATKNMAEDGSVKIEGPHNTQVPLNGLNIAVNHTSTLYMRLKKTGQASTIRLFALGTFTLDGTWKDTSSSAFGEPQGYADGSMVAGSETEDGYAIYQFVFQQWTGSGNSNPIYFSKITAFSISFWTDLASATGGLQIQSVYTESTAITGNVTVKYQVGSHEITETLAAGAKVSYPTELVQNSYTYGRKILGYYADAEFTKEYDFNNWVYENTTIYVKLSDSFYLDPVLCTMADTSKGFATSGDGYKTEISNGKVNVIGNHASWWQVTFQQIWTKIAEDDIMLMKVKGMNEQNYLYARVWGTDRAGNETSYAAYKINGTLVGSDSDGYSIYEFNKTPQLNALSIIKGIRLDVYGSKAQIELAYIRAVKTTSMPVEVTYYEGDELKYTQKVTPGETATKPTGSQLGITDKKVCGFYTDKAFTQAFDFQTEVTEATKIYIQTKAYLNLTNDFWAANKFGIPSGEKFTGNGDGTFTYTKGTATEAYMNRTGLDVALREGQKIKLVAKVEGFSGIMAYPFGTFVENGETKTIGGATSGYNWRFDVVGTTEDGYTIYELDVTKPNDSNHRVEFETLTGIRIDLTGGTEGSTFLFKQLYTE